MRTPALLLALLLVLLAGVVPACLGISRGLRVDEVVAADGRVLRGTLTSDTPEGVAIIASGRYPEDVPRSKVREFRRGTLFPDEVETTEGTVLRGEVVLETSDQIRIILPSKAVSLDRRDVVSIERNASWSPVHLRSALSDPFHWRVLGWTAAVALLGTLGALLLGLPYAILTARTDLPGRGFFAALYGAPLVLPPLLTAMAWDTILPRSFLEGSAALGRWSTAFQAGALFALAYFPFVTLFARRALSSVGASEEEAARLAAGPWKALRRVTLPLARPGIVLGALFAFVFCLNDFGVVDYLNVVRTASKQISVYPFLVQFNYSRKVGGVEELLVLGIPVALVSLAATAAALRIATRGDTATVGSAWRPPRPLPLGPAGKAAGMLFCGAVLAAGALVPALSLLREAGSPATYATIFGAGGAGVNLRLTLGLAAAAAVLAVPTALVLADAGRRLGGWSEGLRAARVVLPLALVPALVPLGSLQLWDRPLLTFLRGNAPWNPVKDTEILPALVVFSRVLPFALAATWASLREVRPSLHEAARVAGVPWDAGLRRITLPLARPGIVLGALLAFVFAVRELDALAVLGTNTLIRKIWYAIHFQRDANVAAMAVVLLAVMAAAFAAAALTGWLRPRGQEARGGAPAASASRSSTSA